MKTHLASCWWKKAMAHLKSHEPVPLAAFKLLTAFRTKNGKTNINIKYTCSYAWHTSKLHGCILTVESISALCPKLNVTHLSNDEQSESMGIFPHRQLPSISASRKKKRGKNNIALVTGIWRIHQMSLVLARNTDTNLVNNHIVNKDMICLYGQNN